ncbi:MAG TPA: IS1182 family transposase [Isosphaeraceae bacterium]|nr:IS1182 family transposase [Isosphaeraceae bacterium]
MKRLIDADYSVQYLLPPSVEDWVPPNHPVRFLRTFVECLDLQALGFKIPRSLEGGSVFAPSLLLKIWLYAWYERIRSTRRMERLCRTDLPLIWLAGQNTPDHNTLWRFWADNRKALKAVLRQSVRVAVGSELVGMVLHAVDGTKLLAHSARRSALHREDLEKLLAKVDETIAHMEGELEKMRLEEADATPAPALQEKLTDARTRRQVIEEGLKKLDEEKADHLQPSEPDAEQMKAGQRVEWAWNAQAVVDSESGLIVAAELDNEALDAHHLVSMIEEVEENTQAVAAMTVADSGYSKSDQELAEAAKKKYPVTVARSRQEKDAYHRSQFSFDREAGTCVCPEGVSLARDGTANYEYQEGRAVRFRCNKGESCPAFELCRRKKESKGRTVEFSPHHELIVEHKKVLAGEEGKAALKKRREVVEPVFGSIKHNDGFRRVSVRGEEKARAQWMLMCTVWNLRRLWRFWQEGKLSLEKMVEAAKQAKGAEKGAIGGLSALSERLGELWNALGVLFWLCGARPAA